MSDPGLPAQGRRASEVVPRAASTAVRGGSAFGPEGASHSGSGSCSALARSGFWPWSSSSRTEEGRSLPAGPPWCGGTGRPEQCPPPSARPRLPTGCGWCQGEAEWVGAIATLPPAEQVSWGVGDSGPGTTPRMPAPCSVRYALCYVYEVCYKSTFHVPRPSHRPIRTCCPLGTGNLASTRCPACSYGNGRGCTRPA